MKYFLLLFLFVNCLMIVNAKDNCLEIRAAFDVGSGTTKMVVAKVDSCKMTVLKVLLEEDIIIPFKQKLSRNKNGKLGKDIINLAVVSIEKMKKKAGDVGATNYYAVATAAFRQAKDGQDAIKKLSEKLKMKFEVISQNREAILGYYAARQQIQKNSDYIVWDIGGASMQMVYRDKNKKFKLFLGDLASVSLRDYIVEKIQKKKMTTNITPNPIGKSTNTILAYVNNHATKNVPKEMKAELSKKDVYGIGGVHYYSIRKQCAKKERFFTQETLSKCLDSRKNMNDKEIGGSYASTDISNIALVLGYMKALGIKKVTPVRANMAYGIILDPVLWK